MYIFLKNLIVLLTILNNSVISRLNTEILVPSLKLNSYPLNAFLGPPP